MENRGIEKPRVESTPSVNPWIHWTRIILVYGIALVNSAIWVQSSIYLYSSPESMWNNGYGVGWTIGSTLLILAYDIVCTEWLSMSHLRVPFMIMCLSLVFGVVYPVYDVIWNVVVHFPVFPIKVYVVFGLTAIEAIIILIVCIGKGLEDLHKRSELKKSRVHQPKVQ